MQEFLLLLWTLWISEIKRSLFEKVRLFLFFKACRAPVLFLSSAGRVFSILVKTLAQHTSPELSFTREQSNSFLKIKGGFNVWQCLFIDLTVFNPNSQAKWLVDVRQKLIYIVCLQKLLQKILGKSILLLQLYKFKSAYFCQWILIFLRYIKCTAHLCTIPKTTQ